MLKSRMCPLFFFTAFVALISIADAADNYITIDAFTSASRRMRVDTARIYPDHADIYWWEYYEQDAKVLEYKIKWGTDAGVMTDSLDLRPYTEKVTNLATITPLQENTHYYAQFYREYNRRAYITNFEFTTPLPIAVIRDNAVSRSSNVGANVSAIDLYTMDGRRVMVMPVESAVSAGSLFRSAGLSGLFVAKYIAKSGNTVKTESILISK